VSAAAHLSCTSNRGSDQWRAPPDRDQASWSAAQGCLRAGSLARGRRTIPAVGLLAAWGFLHLGCVVPGVLAGGAKPMPISPRPAPLAGRHLAADVGPAALDAVLDALADNARVEALYIQNFERVRSPGASERLQRQSAAQAVLKAAVGAARCLPLGCGGFRWALGVALSGSMPNCLVVPQLFYRRV